MADDFDWRRVRADFAATRRLAYLNSAATGLVSRQAAEAAAEFYRDAQDSGDARWFDWLRRRESVRASVARMINADPEEIGLTINTSQGMSLIAETLEGRGEVVSCELEFPTSTLPWMQRGVRVHLIRPNRGAFDADDVRAAMTERTGVVCLSHVQYSNGFRAPLAEIGAAKGRHKFVVNAAQSAGVFRIDVRRMRIDALTSTGHKWMLAGFGSGFVYLSRELLAETRPRAASWMSVEDPFAMRNDEYTVRDDAAARVELGCPHFAGIFALGAAADYHLAVGPERVERRALVLNRLLTECLSEAGWQILSPLNDEAMRSAETLVACADRERVLSHLKRAGVAVSSKPEGFRVATHLYNDVDDVARLASALDETRRPAVSYA
jgi:cysteine desulfurase / selenocysteine lyase